MKIDSEHKELYEELQMLLNIMVFRKISHTYPIDNIKRYDDSGTIIPNYEDFLRLTPNLSGFDDVYIDYFKSVSNTFYKLLENTNILLNVPQDEVIGALMRLQSNSLHFNHMWGCFPTFSYINHSCRPNCIIYDDNYEFFLQTLQSIPAGDELTIDYGVRYQNQPFKSLEQTCKEWTKENYSFECSCSNKPNL